MCLLLPGGCWSVGESWWCQTTAFISMSVSYALSTAYVAVSVATLAFVRQRGAGHGFARLVHVVSVSGWLMGVGISAVFVQRGQFGSYRDLYCMVPLDKYDTFTIGMVRRAGRQGPTRRAAGSRTDGTNS